MSKSKETKFTPGPWHVKPDHVNGTVNSETKHIALCNFFNCHEETQRVTQTECEANAALISAAPEMYVVLAGLLKLHEESNSAMCVHRNAKADGCYEEVAGRFIAAMHDIEKREIKLMAQARTVLKKAVGEA